MPKKSARFTPKEFKKFVNDHCSDLEDALVNINKDHETPEAEKAEDKLIFTSIITLIRAIEKEWEKNTDDLFRMVLEHTIETLLPIPDDWIEFINFSNHMNQPTLVIKRNPGGMTIEDLIEELDGSTERKDTRH